MKDPARIITIDGPAGSGKTTVARMLAQHLGYGLLDSGSLYRTFTWLVLAQDPKLLASGDEDGLLKFVKMKLQELDFYLQPEGLQINLGNQSLKERLRLPEVEEWVSQLAAFPQIRSLVNHLLRKLAQGRSVVAEGRDMGSVVFPEAAFKVFLTASSEVRAQRRYLEWKKKGLSVSPQEVRDYIQTRDQKDSSRSVAPLTIPQGALVIDTSNLSPQEVLHLILEKFFFRYS